MSFLLAGRFRDVLGLSPLSGLVEEFRPSPFAELIKVSCTAEARAALASEPDPPGFDTLSYIWPHLLDLVVEDFGDCLQQRIDHEPRWRANRMGRDRTLGVLSGCIQFQRRHLPTFVAGPVVIMRGYALHLAPQSADIVARAIGPGGLPAKTAVEVYAVPTASGFTRRLAKLNYELERETKGLPFRVKARLERGRTVVEVIDHADPETVLPKR